MNDNDTANNSDEKITLNGKPVTKEKFEEQKKLLEKTGAKLIEVSPGNYKIPLRD